MFELVFLVVAVLLGVYITQFNPRLLCFEASSSGFQKGDVVEVHYFPSRGRAEAIRLMLEFAGVDYEDKFYARDEWASVHKKSGKFPFGQMPLLVHGTTRVAQSQAIVRHIARLTGMAGKNESEVTQADELAGYVEDLRKPYGALVYNASARELKAAFMRDTLQPAFARLEARLVANGGFYGGGAHFVGNDYTYADVMLYDVCDCYQRLVDASASATLNEQYPMLMGFQRKFEALPNIKAYISSKRIPTCNGPSAFLDAAK